MNLKERLTKKYQAERAAGLAAVEAEYKKKMQALEVVWRSMQPEPAAGLFRPVVAAPKPPPATRQKQIKGITQAVDRVTAGIQEIFSPEDILGTVAAMFPGRDVKRQSITDSLWRLEQDNKVRVVVQGRGQRKGQYERIKNGNGSVTQSVSEHQELTM